MIDKHYTNELNVGRYQCVMAPSLRAEVHSLGIQIAKGALHIYIVFLFGYKYMHSNSFILQNKC